MSDVIENVATDATETDEVVETEEVESTDDDTQELDADPSSDEQSEPLFEVKINGQVIKMTREEVLANASLGAGAQSKFQEAANLRKEVETVFQALQSNPLETLKHLGISLGDKLTLDQLSSIGIDIDSQVDKYVEKKLAEFDKSPEQKALESKQKAEEEKEKKIKELEDKLREREESEALIQAETEIQNEIIGALKTSTELEATPYVVKRMATAMQLGYSAVDAAKLIEKEYMQEWESRLAKMNESQLMKLIGKDKMEDMRKKRLDKRKKIPDGVKKIADTGSGSGDKKAVNEKISMSDFFDKIGK